MSGSPVSYEELIAFAAGELDGPAAARVAAHVNCTPSAAATVALYRTVLATAQADDSVAPPAASTDAAQMLFRERAVRARASQSGWLAELKRIVAALVFDSRAQAALPGVRGRAEAYQLSFESDLADVDLEISPPESPAAARTIRGQVAPRTADRPGAAALVPAGTPQPVATVEPDAHGMFTVLAEPGHYELLIRLGDRLLVLPHVLVE